MVGQRREGRRARLDAIAARVRVRIGEERERRFVVALAFAFADRGRRTAAPVLAGALAFRLFLTLLPLVLVLVVGLGLLKSVGGSPTDVLRQAGIKGVLASSIDTSSSFSDPGRAAVLVLAVVGVLSGARISAATLRAIHALAWGEPVVRWRRRGRAAMIFLGAVVVAIVCGALGTRARADSGVALSLGAALLMALVAGLIWLGASQLLPHREGVGWSTLVPGAVLVGLGLALLEAVTTNWIGPKLEHASSLYGPLAVSIVVLGWLYVIGRLMVAAPLLNAALLERREAGAQARPAPVPAARQMVSPPP